MVNGDRQARARELEPSIDCNPRPDNDDSKDWCCSVCKHDFNRRGLEPWKWTKREICPELHFYRPPSSTKFVIPPVILLLDNLSVDDLSLSEKTALWDGRAAFITLPA
jgi:hypothetical protein